MSVKSAGQPRRNRRRFVDSAPLRQRTENFIQNPAGLFRRNVAGKADDQVGTSQIVGNKPFYLPRRKAFNVLFFAERIAAVRMCPEKRPVGNQPELLSGVFVLTLQPGQHLLSDPLKVGFVRPRLGQSLPQHVKSNRRKSLGS